MKYNVSQILSTILPLQDIWDSSQSLPSSSSISSLCLINSLIGYSSENFVSPNILLVRVSSLLNYPNGSFVQFLLLSEFFYIYVLDLKFLVSFGQISTLDLKFFESSRQISTSMLNFNQLNSRFEEIVMHRYLQSSLCNQSDPMIFYSQCKFYPL